MATVLIVDDEVVHAQALARFLTRRNHVCDVAVSGSAARDWLERRRPDLVLLDLRLGDADGMTILRELAVSDPTVPVIIMTAYGSVESAVEAMKAGAHDYVQKPVDLEELAITVSRGLEQARTRDYLERLQRSQRGWADSIEFIASSAAMQPVVAFIERLEGLSSLGAGEHPTVLILGETGTGKGLLARVLHARSAIAAQPFIALDCTALPRDLIEAELFGYERGAFTDAKTAKAGLFEVARGGTLFLDEVAELTLDGQKKLLRAIEEKQVRRVGGLHDTSIDIRIIAATNRNPDELVDAGSFRRDLLYRLNVLTITLPPLRNRREDIQLLADNYLALYARKYARPQKSFADEARALLASDPWIGNVRELSHVIERAVLLEDGEVVEARHLWPRGHASLATPRAPDVVPPTGRATLHDIERTHIRRVLDEQSWNISEAARRLGVSRESLRYRMRKYGIVAGRS